MRPLLAALLLAFPIVLPASAEVASVRLAGARIDYDPAVWRVGGVGTGAGARGAIVFTCIAADCEGEPVLFASTTPMVPGQALACAATERLHREPVAVLVPAPPGGIAFSAWAAWSGCRALDSPILAACGSHAGIAYHFSNTLSEGCNRSPELSEARLVELLSGVHPE